jgi:hypothetical protein
LLREDSTEVGSGDRGMDGAGCPRGGRLGERFKDGAGGGAEVKAAFGVPLEPQNEVAGAGGRQRGGLASLHGFDDGVLGAAGGDPKTIAGNAESLVVAGVDGKAEIRVGGDLGGCLRGREEGCEKGSGIDGRRVGDGYRGACAMVDGKGCKILDEGAAAPDVEVLATKADGKDGFVEIVGVLEEQFVCIFAGVVRRRSLREGIVAVALGVNVGGASREKYGVAGTGEGGDIGRG